MTSTDRNHPSYETVQSGWRRWLHGLARGALIQSAGFRPDRIWGEADDTVGRIAAEGTAEFIKADYRFAPLPGIGHYAADQQPARVSELLLDHLTRHPV